MPSQATNEISIDLIQLIPPTPQPTRGRSFQLSSFSEWFVYPHGKSVYMYNLKDPKLCKEYREHAYSVGVAKFSPSGLFIASGDQNGNLRIWSCEDFSTKLEVKVIGGPVNEISWSEDEKLVGVAGEGREKFAAVIKVDGGSSFGELIGPSKTCTSISLNSTNCLLASDDHTLTIFRASPTFKFVKTLKDHVGFVQVVRFNATGNRFASGGADGKINVYSTDSYDVIVNGKWHDASVLAMEWITDDILLTASADKTLKLWQIPDGKLINSVSAPPDSTFEKQISGFTLCETENGNEKIVILLRLDGSIELRDSKNLNLLKSLKEGEKQFTIGHSKNIVDLAHDVQKNLLTSVSYDGSLKTWKISNSISSNKKVACINHSDSDSGSHGGNVNWLNKNVQKLWFSVNGASNDFRAIFENKLMNSDGSICDFGAAKIVGYGGPENNLIILSDGSVSAIVGTDGVVQKLQKKLPLNSLNNSITVHLAVFDPTNKILALTTENQLTLLSTKVSSSSSDFVEFELIQSVVSAKITAMAFDPSSRLLATADDQRRIKLYTNNDNVNNSNNNIDNNNTDNNITNKTWVQQPTQWTNHSARIDTLLWLNSSILLSAGVDANLLAWHLEGNKYGPVGVVRGAHSAPFNKLLKINEGVFVSAGSDSCIKAWTCSDCL